MWTVITFISAHKLEEAQVAISSRSSAVYSECSALSRFTLLPKRCLLHASETNQFLVPKNVEETIKSKTFPFQWNESWFLIEQFHLFQHEILLSTSLDFFRMRHDAAATTAQLSSHWWALIDGWIVQVHAININKYFIHFLPMCSWEAFHSMQKI